MNSTVNEYLDKVYNMCNSKEQFYREIVTYLSKIHPPKNGRKLVELFVMHGKYDGNDSDSDTDSDSDSDSENHSQDVDKAADFNYPDLDSYFGDCLVFISWFQTATTVEVNLRLPYVLEKKEDLIIIPGTNHITIKKLGVNAFNFRATLHKPCNPEKLRYVIKKRKLRLTLLKEGEGVWASLFQQNSVVNYFVNANNPIN